MVSSTETETMRAAPQNGKAILYFRRHSRHFEQWTIVDGRRIDLPDLVNPELNEPGLCLTHWPSRRIVIFDEAVESD